MGIEDIIFIGVALSMDACAITIANCTTQGEKLSKSNAWLMPSLFAIFQGIMPLLGYFIGALFYEYIGAYGKYLTAGIFFILGIKILLDIIKETKEKDECGESSVPSLSAGLIAIQALATSIDALVVGVTLNEYSLPFYVSAIIIAGVTFILVTIAMFLGQSLGKLLGKYSNYVALAIMLFLAIKNLF